MAICKWVSDFLLWFYVANCFPCRTLHNMGPCLLPERQICGVSVLQVPQNEVFEGAQSSPPPHCPLHPRCPADGLVCSARGVSGNRDRHFGTLVKNIEGVRVGCGGCASDSRSRRHVAGGESAARRTGKIGGSGDCYGGHCKDYAE